MAKPHLVGIPLAAQPVVPWRNGGGTTREVAAERDGARGEFRWRVSIAQVDRDGPFSAYPGTDRTLWLLRGAGVRLVVDGSEVVLDRLLEPFALRGESVVESFLLAGPCEDLNVMVERATTRADARVVRLEPHGRTVLAPARARESLVLALDARVEVATAGAPALVLSPGDAALDPSGAGVITVTAGSERAALLAARFERVG